MSDKTQRWMLGLILGLYLALGLAYSIVNPILESPDETLNYQNIRYFAEERRLPVLREDELSKGHHPPLYYALGALLTGWVPNQQLDTIVARTNPFWAYRLWEPGVDNKNLYLHDSQLEGWPYRDVALGVHLMRWVSLLMGAGVIVVIYRIAYELFVGERWLALGAAALVAFNPMFLYIQSSVHNDAMTNLLAALTLWGIVIYWLRGPSPRRAAFLGLVCGLGVLTKITFLFLLPAVAVAVIWRSWLERHSNPRWWQDLVRLALIAGGLTVLISGWWFVRNQLIYGEPTSMGRQAQVWGIRKNAPDFGAAFRELGFLYNSFWGVFGYGQIPMPAWVYLLLGALAWCAAGGLAIWLIRSRPRGWHYRAPAALLAALTLAALTAFGATFARMTVSATADFGRYLFTAYGVFAPALVLGLTEWLPARRRLAASGILAVLFLLLAMSVLVAVLAPAYHPAPRLPTDQVEQTIHNRLDWQFGDVVTLLGYDVSPAAVRAGEDVTVTFYWQPLRTVSHNYTVFVHLFGADNDLVGARDTYPGLGRDPTMLWTPEEIIVDAIPIPTDLDASAPILLDIEAGLYDLEADERLPIQDAAGNPIGYPILGTVKLLGDQQPLGQPTYLLGAEFEEGLVLEGYDLSATALDPGSVLTLTLYWAPTGPLAVNYTTFVHLVDKAGQIVGQGDGPPLGGRYPTTAWGAGERFADSYEIFLPADMVPGGHALLVGLYDPRTYERLLLVGGGDHLKLEPAIIVR